MSLIIEKVGGRSRIEKVNAETATLQWQQRKLWKIMVTYAESMIPNEDRASPAKVWLRFFSSKTHNATKHRTKFDNI